MKMSKVVFILSPNDLDRSSANESLRESAIIKCREVIQGGGIVRYGYNRADANLRMIKTLAEFDRLLPPNERTAQQDSAGQPATRPELDSMGGGKPQPESEGRSR